MDSPKRVLVHLEGLDTSKLPAAVLSAAGIRKDGIVAVDVPRFPRVSDVKMALARLLRIPVPDQVLRGPLPQTTKLSRDWVHLYKLNLHKLNILPGLRVDGDKRKTERRDKVRNAGGSHPGELFSSISPLAARIDQNGSAVSDILQLSTKQPIVAYLPGGVEYMKRVQRRRQRWMLLRLALLLLIAAAVLYGLWLVPGYEMPSYSNPAPVLGDIAHEAVNNSSAAPGAAASDKQLGYGSVAPAALEEDVIGGKGQSRQDEL
eukprot:CAMPEP_0177755086 /NCGR_PEP_ID=MMETSP0491_2-20121128/2374_1 /TAXON_ID=63592 /ORGANISM="Tetraselmis chuii, Strain PLY429" /LENGTH=260 /DNA_ID=CAMNT_0019270551 /DNA_START=446 /DNA_END=1228 /DNA_ORIENTATION=-